jgi:hypothetical protein
MASYYTDTAGSKTARTKPRPKLKRSRPRRSPLLLGTDNSLTLTLRSGCNLDLSYQSVSRAWHRLDVSAEWSKLCS